MRPIRSNSACITRRKPPGGPRVKEGTGHQPVPSFLGRLDCMQALRPLIFVALTTVALPVPAQVTEIYKCVEPSGRSLYTSDKRETAGRKCELVSRQVNVVPGSKGQP